VYHPGSGVRLVEDYG